MRYRVELCSQSFSTLSSLPLEIIDCDYIELDAGALAFFDGDKILLRAFAAGHWVALTLVEEDPMLIGEDMFHDITRDIATNG